MVIRLSAALLPANTGELPAAVMNTEYRANKRSHEFIGGERRARIERVRERRKETGMEKERKYERERESGGRNGTRGSKGRKGTRRMRGLSPQDRSGSHWNFNF